MKLDIHQNRRTACYLCGSNSRLFFLWIVFLGVCFFGGCASASKQRRAFDVEGGNLLNTSRDESVHDAVSALKAVTGSLSDRPVTDEELYKAVRAMKDDPEAQTAVEAISSAFDKRNREIRYSPVTGKRYSADIEFEPGTGVRLLPLE